MYIETHIHTQKNPRVAIKMLRSISFVCGVWGVWLSQRGGRDEGKKERAHMHARAWESTKGSLKGSSSDALELELQTVESCLI